MHIYGRTFKLIDRFPARLDSKLAKGEKEKIQAALKSCLVSDSHFEVIKANTEAFTGFNEDDDKDLHEQIDNFDQD